ncbi:DUF5362 family protein [Mucilaginibacter sp. dw_454]|uniref:DUF5362 family protein n=1 Tax=Mucilaginibacter sp. dw_454 TaxID=2720079 RepID=UPI001BD2C98D|nr:DUF5362 family protein [Mucilaginibacter sp. dw_454]
MEETFTTEPQTPEQPQGIILLQDAQSYLLSAGKWARFLGILGFIGTGFITLYALFFGTLMSAMSSFSPTPLSTMGAIPVGFIIFYFILIGVFYFFVSLYIYQFGSRVRDGIMLASSITVTDGLGKLKSAFKLIGIMTIVFMILSVFIIIGVIAFSMHMAHAVTPGFGS